MNEALTAKRLRMLKIVFYAATAFFFANFNITVFGGMFNLYGRLGAFKYFSTPGLGGIFLICALIGIPAASFTMLAVVLARRLNADMLSFFIFAMLLPAAGATVFFLFAGANPRIAVFFVFSEAIIGILRDRHDYRAKKHRNKTPILDPLCFNGAKPAFHSGHILWICIFS